MERSTGKAIGEKRDWKKGQEKGFGGMVGIGNGDMEVQRDWRVGWNRDWNEGTKREWRKVTGILEKEVKRD